ncbi:hypothetical protein [Nocardia salmonicida]|uniref:hypothetical protein n=1 Tax=Nocardia salmonicida TaxID=53431 RepID=UPI0010421480|nr:hypothetical protein [Nocardia salmonicida]
MTSAPSPPIAASPSKDLVVVAILGATTEQMPAEGIHRTMIQAVAAAGRERATIPVDTFPDRGELADALLRLRTLRYVTLDENGFVLTSAGQEAIDRELTDSFRGEVAALVKQKLQEWQIDG